MPKPDPLGETRIANAVERTKRQRRLNAKGRSKRTKPPKRHPPEKDAVGSRCYVKPPATKTKQRPAQPPGRCDDRRAASGDRLAQHSVRGFLAGAVKKKLGINLLSEKPHAQPRRYRISNEHPAWP
jgi:hypothetical protein